MESTLAFHAYAARSRGGQAPARDAGGTAPEVRAKVVMLHGYAMNAKVFSTKTKTLAKKLRQRGFECVYLDAPFLLPMTSIVMVEGVAGESFCPLSREALSSRLDRAQRDATDRRPSPAKWRSTTEAGPERGGSGILTTRCVSSRN